MPNQNSAEKFADRLAKAVVLGGFLSLALLVFVGAYALASRVF